MNPLKHWFSAFASVVVIVSILSVSAPAFAGGERNVNVEVHVEVENPMWTITKSSFWGGIVGLLAATAGLFISEFEMDPAIFGYCAGGGILLGMGVGIWIVATREDPLVPATASREHGPLPVADAYMMKLNVSF